MRFEKKKLLLSFFVIIVFLIFISGLYARFWFDTDKFLEENFRQRVGNMFVKSENLLLGFELQKNYVLGTSKLVDGEIFYDEDASNFIKINSFGFRDEEYNISKPEDVFRIAMVGDSVTFGWHVNVNDGFPNMLEILLENKSLQIQVLNFGVPGYSLFQETELVEEEVLKFEPDLIIITFLLSDLNTEYLGVLDLKEIRRREDVIDSLTGEPFWCDLKNMFSHPSSLLQLNKGFREKTIIPDNEDSSDKVYKYFDRLIDNQKEEFRDECFMYEFEYSLDRLRNISVSENIPVVIAMYPVLSKYVLFEDYPFVIEHELVKKKVEENGLFVWDVWRYFYDIRTRGLLVVDSVGHPSKFGNDLFAKFFRQKLSEEVFW